MNRPRRRTATDLALALALLCAPFAAGAAPAAGTVTQASGVLFAQHASGRTRILAPASTVEEGETLVSGKGGYSQVLLADGSVITLKPEAQLRIDRFSYDAAKPADDHADMTLVAGTVRIASGEIARRAGDRQTLASNLGQMAVGPSSTFVAAIAPPVLVAGLRVNFAQLPPRLQQSATVSDASPDMWPTAGEMPLRLAQMVPPVPPTGGLPPGLYVAVTGGQIILTNPGGASTFTSGQFGYVRNPTTPPVLVPANPGISFTPPPAFSAPPAGPGTSPGAKPGAVDCEVR